MTTDEQVDHVLPDTTHEEPTFDRAAAIAAVDKAIADEPLDGPPAVGAKPAEPTPETTQNRSLSSIIKARESARKEQEAVKSARAEAEKLQSEAQAMRAELEKERAWFAELRKDPRKAIIEAKWEPEALVMDLAKSDTPEGRLALEIRQLRAENEAIQKRLSAEDETRAAAAKQNDMQAAAASRDKVEREFISEATSADKYPVLSRFYTDTRRSAILNEAHSVADKFRDATGENATYAQIAEYLNEQLSELIAAQQVVPVPKSSSGEKKMKPLSGSDSSERRSVPKPDRAWSDAERRKAAIDAVNDVLRTGK